MDYYADAPDLDIMKKPDGTYIFRAFTDLSSEKVASFPSLPEYFYGPHREILGFSQPTLRYGGYSYYFFDLEVYRSTLQIFGPPVTLLASDPVSTDFFPYGCCRIPEIAEGQVVYLINKKFSDGSYDTLPCTVERLLSPGICVPVRLPNGDILQVSRNRLLAEGETVESPLFVGDVVRRTSDGVLYSLVSRQPFGWNGVGMDGSVVVLEEGGFETVFQWANHTIGTIMPDGKAVSRAYITNLDPFQSYLMFDDYAVTLGGMLK